MKSANTDQKPSMGQSSKLYLTYQYGHAPLGSFLPFRASFSILLPYMPYTKTKLPASPDILLCMTPCLLHSCPLYQ